MDTYQGGLQFTKRSKIFALFSLKIFTLRSEIGKKIHTLAAVLIDFCYGGKCENCFSTNFSLKDFTHL